MIDEETEKPRLLTDAARAYSLAASALPGGGATRPTDKEKSEELIEKANALFSEAVRLDPQYGNAYHAWALSLYVHGNYSKAWEVARKSRALGRDFDPRFIGELAQKMSARRQ